MVMLDDADGSIELLDHLGRRNMLSKKEAGNEASLYVSHRERERDPLLLGACMAKTEVSSLVLLYSFAVLGSLVHAAVVDYNFKVGNFKANKLCHQSVITAVNNRFPGPTIQVKEGDTLVVHVLNNSPNDITIHWHGIFQQLSAWADGTNYITQCPIRPGSNYTYRFNITGQEGTLWWHAHNSILRATVHGALIILPQTAYPFPQPFKEYTILLGEWYKRTLVDLENEAFTKGRGLNISDALTINGSPGDLFQCSNSSDIFQIEVEQGKTYLLRLINTALDTLQFFKVAGHTFTVVGADASYTTKYNTDVLVLSPGQTLDVLMVANASPGSYYMASKAFAKASFNGALYDNTTATGIVIYNSTAKVQPVMPTMPAFADSTTADRFLTGLKSLIRPGAPTVPLKVDEQMLITIGLGLFPCGSNQPRCLQFALAASVNNVSFQFPTKMSLLEAHSKGASGVYTSDFPDAPPMNFDYNNATAVSTNSLLLWTTKATKLKKLKYNTTVEVVLQNTALIRSETQPIHLHGFNFFVVAQGYGTYKAAMAVPSYNLVNPQERNTIAVLAGGWAVIRFRANNPGVWFFNSNLDRNLPIGLATAFEVKNGPDSSSTLPPPPLDFPQC